MIDEEDHAPVLGPAKGTTKRPKRNTKRAHKLHHLILELLRMVIRMETEHAIFVRSFKILLDQVTFKCRVSVVKNPHGDTVEDREKAKRFIAAKVAETWGRVRFDRLYVECSLDDGIVNLRYQDWGVLKAPYDEFGEFELVRLKHSMGCDVVVDGFLYDDPKSWIDSIVKPGRYDKSAKEIIESYLEEQGSQFLSELA